jgi:tetratricopeptide (TPR) repeat protein
VRWKEPAVVVGIVGAFVVVATSSDRLRPLAWVAVIALAATAIGVLLRYWLRPWRQNDETWLGLLALEPRRLANTSPYDCGVSREAPDALRALPAGRPVYVKRDEDARLRGAIHALASAGFGGVVVRGAPNSGKSRSLHAALVAEVPEYYLLVPRNRNVLVELLGPGPVESEAGSPLLSLIPPKAEGAVIYVENLEDFLLGESSIRLLDLVQRGVRGDRRRVIVAATLGGHGDVFASLDRQLEDAVDLAASFLASPAVSIHAWRPHATLPEQERLDQISRGLAQQVEEAGGIGKFFIQSRLIETRFQHVTQIDPAARDMLSAATAWHLAGTRSPISLDALRQLWEGVFSSHQYVPSQGTFEGAVRRCAEVIRGSAALMSWFDGGYWVNEHLVELARERREVTSDNQWAAIIDLTDADQAFAAGLSSISTPLLSPTRAEAKTRALRAFERSAHLGNAEAAAAAAGILTREGRSPDAEELLRPFTPTSSTASASLGRLLRRRGDLNGAIDVLSAAPPTRYVATALGRVLRERSAAGDLDRAIEALRPFAGDRYGGEALITALRARKGPGDRAEALAMARSVVDLPLVEAQLLEDEGELAQALDVLRPHINQTVEANHAASILLRRRSPGDVDEAVTILSNHTSDGISACILAKLLSFDPEHRDEVRAIELLQAHRNFGPAQLELARLLRRRDDPELPAVLDHLCELKFDPVFALDVSTLLLEIGNELDRAIAVLEPWRGDHKCASRLAAVYRRAGQPERAVDVLVGVASHPNIAAELQREVRALSQGQRATLLNDLRGRPASLENGLALAFCHLAREPTTADLEHAAAALSAYADKTGIARQTLLEVKLHGDDLPSVLDAADELCDLGSDRRVDHVRAVALGRLVTLITERSRRKGTKPNPSEREREVVQRLVKRLLAMAKRSARVALVVERALRLETSDEALDLRIRLLQPHVEKSIFAANALSSALCIRGKPGDLDEAINVAARFSASNTYSAHALARALRRRNAPGDYERATEALRKTP